MVALPQCRFRFARQNEPSASATGAANFRVAREPPAINDRADFPFGVLLCQRLPLKELRGGHRTWVVH